MAYWITSYCNACGMCLPACPNHAIGDGVPIFRINAWLCTECVGYADEPSCASLCPVEAIVLEDAPARRA